MMRSELSYLASKATPLLKLSPAAAGGGGNCAASFRCGFKKQPHSTSIRASNEGSRPPARTLVFPEPPWLVLPPSPPENPFSGEAWPSVLQVKGVGGTEIPLSLRMVQRKKRLAVAGPVWTDSPPQVEGAGDVEGPIGRAVSALVFMVRELQKSAMAGGEDGAVDESVLDRVSRDRRDSFVWLFRRVFFSSPDLMSSLLLLLADYVVASAEKIGSTATAVIENDDQKISPQGVSVKSKRETIRTGDYLNWFDIGIEEGSLEPRQLEDEETYVDRRRRAYERTIAEGGANSLILCNYAQFLYQMANDHDRAEKYFQWAMMAEPRDAEAMNRYAFFLWEERGNMNRAEEMFLEAIEAEPGNHHYSSTYAWFLWKTGAMDTCYPLDPPPPTLAEESDV